MQTFNEFNIPKQSTKPVMASIPSFIQMRENEGAASCISEMLQEKLNEAYKDMCTEMQAIHADETARTCETYKDEVESKLNEMLTELTKQCESYLAAMH